MDLKGKSIILASNSPRRRELLAGLDIEFTVDTRNTFDKHIHTQRIADHNTSYIHYVDLGRLAYILRLDDNT